MGVITQKIHQPDFSFLKYCEYTFKINRGVYNTIDSWFYKQGVEDILQRRVEIISFLQYSKQPDTDKVKFGRGELTVKLKEFYECNQHSFRNN